MGMKIACTGGGTGGHIFPGIAVLEELKRKRTDLEICWIGSGKQLERGIISRFGIPYFAVPSGKLRRYFSLQNFLDVFRLIGGFFSALLLLRRLKVDVLFSKGGYVSVAPVLAAAALRIPVITHESDRDPGLATRIIARFADVVLLPYEQTRSEHFGGGVDGYRGGVKGNHSNGKGNRGGKQLDGKKSGKRELIVTGNPVRREVLQGDAERGRKHLKLGSERPIVLVLGGSQGARQINQLIERIREELLKDAAVVHQMGILDYKVSHTPGYITAPIFNAEFPDILAAADLVVSRAGAGTVWENGVLGKAAVLIPLGSGSSRGDQMRNAELFVREGAAVALSGEAATPERLLEHVTDLLRNPEKRRDMGDRALGICIPDAAERIADVVLSKSEEGMRS